MRITAPLRNSAFHGAFLGSVLAAVLAAGCAGVADDDETSDTDTDTDAGDTDTDVTGETDDTGDTALPIETDGVDTDGETVVLHGQLWCKPPRADTDISIDTDTGDDDGIPASPGTVEITIVQPWNCYPLQGCSKNENYEVLASTTVDKDGSFDLTFQTNAYTVDELFLYTDHKIGVCGNGYQFTQWPLTDYEDWSDIVIDVDSIFY